MKELFQLLAEYNIQTNRAMIQVLEGVPAEQLSQDVGSFYKSIIGILNHMLTANVGWMKRLSSLFPELEEIPPKLPEISYDMGIVWETLDDLKPVLSEIDDLLKDLVELIPDEKFTDRLTYTNYRGEEVNKLAYHILLHVFNHQTHNRGMVAALLDQFGVENDYSNIIGLQV